MKTKLLLFLLTTVLLISCDNDPKMHYRTTQFDIHHYRVAPELGIIPDSMFLPHNCYTVEVTMSCLDKERLDFVVDRVLPIYAGSYHIRDVDDEAISDFLNRVVLRATGMDGIVIESFTILGRKYPDL